MILASALTNYIHDYTQEDRMSLDEIILSNSDGNTLFFADYKPILIMIEARRWRRLAG